MPQQNYKKWRLPEIHNMVLVVAAIDKDLWAIDEKTGKQ